MKRLASLLLVFLAGFATALVISAFRWSTLSTGTSQHAYSVAELDETQSNSLELPEGFVAASLAEMDSITASIISAQRGFDPKDDASRRNRFPSQPTSPPPLPAGTTPPVPREAPSGYVVLKNIPIGGAFDDNWQVGWFAIDNDINIFGRKVGVWRSWQCKTRALRHENIVRITVPNEPGIKERVNSCLAASAIAAAIAALATDGAAGFEGFRIALTACLGAQTASSVQISLEDLAHWTDWMNCTNL